MLFQLKLFLLFVVYLSFNDLSSSFRSSFLFCLRTYDAFIILCKLGWWKNAFAYVLGVVYHLFKLRCLANIKLFWVWALTQLSISKKSGSKHQFTLFCVVKFTTTSKTVKSIVCWEIWRDKVPLVAFALLIFLSCVF